MKHFSRLGALTMIAGGALLVPLAAGADLRPASNTTQWLLSNGSQGYLGVGIHDVDNDRAAALKLKDPHGAEITSIDQDAPAFKSGLRLHDVVVQMNGQRVEGIEQFRRMLHETPSGRTITLVAMRDGQPRVSASNSRTGPNSRRRLLEIWKPTRRQPPAPTSQRQSLCFPADRTRMASSGASPTIVITSESISSRCRPAWPTTSARGTEFSSGMSSPTARRPQLD